MLCLWISCSLGNQSSHTSRKEKCPFIFLSQISFRFYQIFLLPCYSNVYGSNDKEVAELRNFTGGLLKENNAQEHLLPPKPSECRDSTNQKFCFKAGAWRSFFLALHSEFFIRTSLKEQHLIFFSFECFR